MKDMKRNKAKHQEKNIMNKRESIFRIRKIIFIAAAILCIMGAFTGCKNNNSKGSEAGKDNVVQNTNSLPQETLDTKENITSTGQQETDTVTTATEEPTTKEVVITTEEQTTKETETSKGETAADESNESTTPAAIRDKNNRIVAIDPGHQSRGNSEKEPIGPGASTMKAKVASGTKGVATGKPEYQLTLELSIKLKQELESRGYTVVMIRETNDVNISNAERAQIANTSGATAFLRIHADGSENGSVSGATTLCPTAQNPYCADIYKDSRRLSDAVLESLCSSTGCKKRYVSEVDNMSGINWCQIPVSIVEVGFMTNADEDMLLSTEEYQWKVAKGIADGVDKFFGASE